MSLSNAKLAETISDALRNDVNVTVTTKNSVHSRHVAARLSAETEAKASSALRCCNCGLPVREDMKLLVLPSLQRDFVRVPYAWDDQKLGGSFDLSSFVACVPACALRYMYDHHGFSTSRIPHVFAKMMMDRHGQNEPITAAPPPECLSYVQQLKPLNSLDKATSTSRIGLSVAEFYRLLSTNELIGYKEVAPKFIPATWEEKQALKHCDHRFTQYYYQEATSMPGSSTSPGLQLPAWLPAGGIRIDANPDADNEFDIALDEFHKPVSVFSHSTVLK